MLEGFFGSDAAFRVVDEDAFEEVEERFVERRDGGDYVL